MKRYIYGIDVGGTSIKFGLFDLSLALIRKWEIPTNTTEYGRYILDDIVQEVNQHTPLLDEVFGYGFGVPGPVVKNVIHICVNLGWVDMDLPALLQNRLQNDNIYVGNDANVAALGEAFLGAGHGRQNVAMITLGTGVGCGIVVDGRILEGYNGSSGEIGHLTIPQQNPFLCKCGKKGCLETVASATGITNIYTRMKQGFLAYSVLNDVRKVTAKDIFEAAQQHDILANEVVNEAAFYIAYACHVLSVSTNPSVIVIGGGVSNAGLFLLDKIIVKFHELAFTPTLQTQIVLATLGNDAGIYGAAGLVIQHG